MPFLVFYITHPDELEAQLQAGERRANDIANQTLSRVRHYLGF